MPEAFVGRHPFPGPGLAIRCPGEITREKLDILRKADAIYLDEIRKAGLYDVIWQAFAVLLPVRTVGVMGDHRTYDHVCALLAVTSVDGMTADFYPYDMAFHGRTATRGAGRPSAAAIAAAMEAVMTSSGGEQHLNSGELQGGQLLSSGHGHPGIIDGMHHKGGREQGWPRGSRWELGILGMDLQALQRAGFAVVVVHRAVAPAGGGDHGVKATDAGDGPPGSAAF
jgi:hypothetical protein